MNKRDSELAGVPGGPANTPLQYTLARGEALQINQSLELTGSQLLADRPFADPALQGLDHTQVDVGLEQRHAHLAQHVLHVGFGDAGLAPHLFDEAREFVGEG